MDYKKKYLFIKNQIGYGIEDYRAKSCIVKKHTKKLINCDISFNNNFGSCWSLSLHMIFLHSDSTSKCVQYKLNNISSTNILNNYTSKQLLQYILPTQIYNKTEKFINLIDKLKEKFNIKIDDNKRIENDVNNFFIRRQNSKIIEDEFAKIYFNFLNNDLKKDYSYGSNPYEVFFLLNILSCLLLQKLIKIDNYFINDKIETKFFNNTIGILVNMNEHMCSFYICNNKMKFCNNHIIIDYNWINLFTECNKLKLLNKEYQIFLHHSNSDYKGPFINVDNKNIYFYTEQYEENNQNNLNHKSYLSILSFSFLNYTNARYKLKKTNCIYYLEYYMDNSEYYEKFIIENNINSIDLNNIDYKLKTQLFIACYNKQINIIKLLLEFQGLDVNKSSTMLISPLYLSCDKGNEEIVQLLLEHPNIDVNILNKNNLTPLIKCCLLGLLDLVNLLLQHPNIDVNISVKNMTPLYITCQNGYKDIVKLLLQHPNIDVNISDKNITPLFIACQNGYKDIVNLLLKHPNIDVNIKNNINQTPLDIAYHKGYEEIIQLLLEYQKRF